MNQDITQVEMEEEMKGKISMSAGNITGLEVDLNLIIIRIIE